MHCPLPSQREIGARLALRDDMEPGLKPLPVFLRAAFSRSILELKSHSRTILYLLRVTSRMVFVAEFLGAQIFQLS
jgi:hypothetical protein